MSGRPFRLALGTCSCSHPYHDAVQKLACHLIETRLTEWQNRLPGDLAAVAVEHYETEHVEGHWVTISTLKRTLEDGCTVVAFGTLIHTWRAPTYFAPGVVGRLYVEGLLVDPDGGVTRAPDTLMWEFR